MKKILTPSPLAVSRAMNTLIEGEYWPATLSTEGSYIRRHDDTHGETGIDQELAVTFSRDGDAWVMLPGFTSLRFRTWAGGGMSLRVRKGLLVLAEAIRRDNAERPQPALSAGRAATEIDWHECARISDLPDVDDALCGFAADQTADNATCLVRAVLATQARAPLQEHLARATGTIDDDRRPDMSPTGDLFASQIARASDSLSDDPEFIAALAAYAQNYGQSGEAAARFEVADFVQDWAARPMDTDNAELRTLRTQLGTMRSAFHVNMLRAFPDKTHEELSAEIDLSLGAITATATARNFCPVCGKRVGSPESIHTCAPPTDTLNGQ